MKYKLNELKKTRYYMLSMSEGVNPCTGETAAENDVIARQSVQDCCEYVMMILDKMIERCKRSRNRKCSDEITEGSYLLEWVELSDKPIGVNQLAGRINAVLGDNRRNIIAWFLII